MPLAPVFPADYRIPARQWLRPGGSPVLLHPKACLLVLPCRNSRRRRKRWRTWRKRTMSPAKHPPLCLRSISETRRGWQLREHGDPTSSVSTAHCQHLGLHRGSLWREPAGTLVAWTAVPSFWNPLKSLHGLVGGNRTFHQMQIGSPPLPLQVPGAGVGRGWPGVESALALCLAFPLPLHPSWGKPAKLSWKESLFRILTFSSV